ncbi:MAG: RNA-binding S4 domain-containing protein [Saprospiraceae bacterium]|nr:RNA-binding S4 domain-containing protein [Saprospiraceae bacterium]
MDKVRVDKWLWGVRIFKTRTLATDEIKSGKVRINGADVKPSQNVNIGDVVMVKKNGFNFEYKVLDLVDKRVGSPIALLCYQNLTPPEELKKFEAWYVAKSGGEFREKGLGRPTKKDRRTLDDFKGD